MANVYASGGETSSSLRGGTEHVRNGDFEQISKDGSGLPLAWVQNVRKTGNKGEIVQVSDKSFSGRTALRIRPNRNNDDKLPIAVAQEIPAADLRGKELIFSGRITSEGGAKGLIGLMNIVRGKQGEFSMIFLAPSSGEWEYQEKRYRVPDDPDVKLYLSLWTSDTKGTVWFDDVSIRLADGEQTGTTNTGAQESPVTPPRAGASQPTTPALSASVSVDANNVIRDIPATLFGANIEWRWNATSLWQERQKRVDPEILKLADDMGVTLIRYPGGIYSDHYHWRDGIGPYEKRPKVRHEPGKTNESRPNFGTDEALKFADDIGAELLITVNITTGTAKEAADWVQYVNKDGLRVRFWEIGNEQYINSNSAVSKAATMKPEVYARKVRDFAAAMKAADPRIQIGIIGGLNEGSYRQMDYRNWDKIVIKAAGEYADFISVHNAYAPILTGDEKNKDLRTVYRAMLGRSTAIARNLDRLAAEIDSLYPPGAKRPFIAVTEWGPIFQFFNHGVYVDHPKTLGSALFVAGTLKAFIESQATEMAAFWMLNDYGVLGWIASANDDFPPDPEWIPTARYYVFQMFSRFFGSQLLASDTRTPTFDTRKVGWSDAEKGLPYLDVVSSLSSDGKSLYVLAINNHFDSAISTDINIRGFEPRAGGSRWVLSGTAIDAHTGTKLISVPGQERSRQMTDREQGRFEKGSPAEIWFDHDSFDSAAERFIYEFPPRSVTTLKLTRK